MKEKDEKIIELDAKANNPDRICKNCGATFLSRHSRPICNSCYEEVLFSQVKKYIRENEVTEFEVANYFRIPIRLVKKWIRQGRVEYKENKLSTENLYCKTCGTRINFGNYCCDCLRFIADEQLDAELDFDAKLEHERRRNEKKEYLSFM